MSDWKAELDDFFDRQEYLKRDEAAKQARERQQIVVFLDEVVVPAFDEVKAYLEERGRQIKISADAEKATIAVSYQGRPEILYRLYAKSLQPAIVYAYFDKNTGKAIKAKDVITVAEGEVPLTDITQEVIIQHFIRKYKSVAF